MVHGDLRRTNILRLRTRTHGNVGQDKAFLIDFERAQMENGAESKGRDQDARVLERVLGGGGGMEEGPSVYE